MANSKPLTQQHSTLGDAAVDGLINGVIAGILMTLYLILAGLVTSEGPAQMLARFDPGAEPSPLRGALMHLAVAGVYGVLFGLGRRLVRWRSRLPDWLAGLAYGLGVLLIAEVILLPGANSPLRQIPLLHFAVAHVVYGLTLGMRTGR